MSFIDSLWYRMVFVGVAKFERSVEPETVSHRIGRCLFHIEYVMCGMQKKKSGVYRPESAATLSTFSGLCR